MRLKLFGALVGVLTLAVAVTAYAATIAETRIVVKGSVTPKKSGTKKKPKSLKVVLNMTQSTTNPADPQPTTTKGFEVVFPKEWKLNSKKWPKKARCSQAKADKAQSTKPCPKASKVGSGTTTALVAQGVITSTLKVSAHVLTTGNIGFFIDTDVPITIKRFLVGKVRGRNLTIGIPDDVRNTAAGKSGITILNNSLGGTVKVGGKKLGLLESTGCKKGKWVVKFTNVAEDGRLPTTPTSKCTK